MKGRVFIIWVVGLILAVSLFFGGVCEAALVTGWATGDNTFWVWDYKGAGKWDSNAWYPVGGWGDWKTAHKIYGDASIGETINLYFAVKNDPYASLINPAGFLASLTTDSGYFKETGTQTLVSDTVNWDIAVVNWTTFPGTNDPTLILESLWQTPTWYAKNTKGPGSINPTYISLVDFPTYGDNKSIWYEVNGGKVSNIANDAEWLWTANNFNYCGNQYAVLRSSFTVIPEPATLSLLGLGLLGILGRTRSRKI